ncbi:MAG: AAA family ATPase [Bacillota bacterium]
MDNTEPAALFGHTVQLPDSDYRSRLSRLVGLDDHKKRLAGQLRTILNPNSVDDWAKAQGYQDARYLLDAFKSRPPLIILAGDVGSGKTELAETIGDQVARDLSIQLTLLPLSLSSRGGGLVGEMTRLLTAAFDEVENVAGKLKAKSGQHRGGVILLIDEADALAQSREAQQMHHEDKAGVNALIRGINGLSHAAAPAAVIMCTNRLSALDPAIRRRAADVIEFTRPDETQRARLLRDALTDVGLDEDEIQQVARLTGKTEARDFGFTYSDLTQRFLPALVLAAYPNRPINLSLAKSVLKTIEPTPPFREAQ